MVLELHEEREQAVEQTDPLQVQGAGRAGDDTSEAAQFTGRVVRKRDGRVAPSIARVSPTRSRWRSAPSWVPLPRSHLGSDAAQVDAIVNTVLAALPVVDEGESSPLSKRSRTRWSGR